MIIGVVVILWTMDTIKKEIDMKRKDERKIELKKLYQEGYNAGLAGKDVNFCPDKTYMNERKWKEGYDDGKEMLEKIKQEEKEKEAEKEFENTVRKIVRETLSEMKIILELKMEK